MKLRKALCAAITIVMLFALTACKSSGASKLKIKLNGITVKAPFTVEKLGDEYSVFFGAIEYKDDLIAFAVFDEDATEIDDRKKKIKTLMNFENDDRVDTEIGLSVNGFFSGYTKSQAQSMIGEPNEKIQSNEFLTNDPLETWIYRENGASEDDSYLVIRFDKYDRAWAIIVDLE